MSDNEVPVDTHPAEAEMESKNEVQEESGVPKVLLPAAKSTAPSPATIARALNPSASGSGASTFMTSTSVADPIIMTKTPRPFKDKYLLPGNSIDQGLKNDLERVNKDMEGVYTTEKPHVSKDVMIKSITSNATVMKTIVTEVGGARKHVVDLNDSHDKLQTNVKEIDHRLSVNELNTAALRETVNKQAATIANLETAMKAGFAAVEANMLNMQRDFEKKLLEQHNTHVELMNTMKAEQAEVNKTYKSDITALKASRDSMFKIIEDLKEKIAKNDLANAKFDASQVIFKDSKTSLDVVMGDVKGAVKINSEKIAENTMSIAMCNSKIASLPSKEDLFKMEEAQKEREKKMVEGMMFEDEEEESIAPLNSSPSKSTTTGGAASPAPADAPRRKSVRGGGGMSEAVQASLKAMTDRLNEMQNSVSNIDRGLGHKIDTDKVEERLDAKYDEIVKYLQTAISAAAQEEDEFKTLASNLQDVVKTLMATKADKTELSALGEKLSLGGTLVEQMDNIKMTLDMKANKADVEPRLSAKLDRDDFTRSINKIQNSINNTVKQQVEILKEPTAAPWLAGANAAKVAEGNSNSILCLSCNKRRSEGCHDHDTKGIAKLGPGGPSMGGGFQVKISGTVSPSNNKMKAAARLPRLENERETSPPAGQKRGDRNVNKGILIADDGTVYQGGRGLDAYPVIHSSALSPFGHTTSNNSFTGEPTEAWSEPV